MSSAPEPCTSRLCRFLNKSVQHRSDGAADFKALLHKRVRSVLPPFPAIDALSFLGFHSPPRVPSLSASTRSSDQRSPRCTPGSCRSNSQAPRTDSLSAAEATVPSLGSRSSTASCECPVRRNPIRGSRCEPKLPRATDVLSGERSRWFLLFTEANRGRPTDLHEVCDVKERSEERLLGRTRKKTL